MDVKPEACKICGEIGEGYEMSAVDKSESDRRAVAGLEAVVQSDGRTPSGVYRCTACGRYYASSLSQEWDSFNEVMLDIEKWRPLTDDEARDILNPPPHVPDYVDINASRRCSKCHSANVESLRETKVNDDILVWCRCKDCGNEEFMDVYEDDAGGWI